MRSVANLPIVSAVLLRLLGFKVRRSGGQRGCISPSTSNLREPCNLVVSGRVGISPFLVGACPHWADHNWRSVERGRCEFLTPRRCCNPKLRGHARCGGPHWRVALLDGSGLRRGVDLQFSSALREQTCGLTAAAPDGGRSTNELIRSNSERPPRVSRSALDRGSL